MKYLAEGKYVTLAVIHEEDAVLLDFLAQMQSLLATNRTLEDINWDPLSTGGIGQIQSLLANAVIDFRYVDAAVFAMMLHYNRGLLARH